MASQDRSYYRDSQAHRTGSLARLARASLPIFSLGGFQVRIHAAALLAAMIYLAAASAYSDLPQHLFIAGSLLVLLLIHESGHCLVATLLGGIADEVVLWPLGGLVDARPPRRPLPELLTALAGPAANAVVCASCWLALRILALPGPATLNPFALGLPAAAWHDPRFYLLTTFDLSYLLMLLNLLPILPLDGGRVLQCILWPSMGYGWALLSACNIGIALAIVSALSGMAFGNWLLCVVMICCLAITVQRRAALNAAGVGSTGVFEDDRRRPRRHHLTRLTRWRARRQIRREEAESIRVDEILSKVYRSGLHSLTWGEKRLLRRATVRQRECATDEPSGKP